MMSLQAKQAGQSQNWAPFALISLAWSSIALALSAPKRSAAIGEAIKLIVSSIRAMFCFATETNSLVNCACLSVPSAASQDLANSLTVELLLGCLKGLVLLLLIQSVS